MRFVADKQCEMSDESFRRMYCKMLSGWAGDLLQARPRIEWPKTNPTSNCDDHNWHLLYSGSVLDD